MRRAPGVRVGGVHHRRRRLRVAADLDKDGKLDDADYKFVSERAITVLQDNGMVATGAFAAGFAYGFYGYGAS